MIVLFSHTLSLNAIFQSQVDIANKPHTEPKYSIQYMCACELVSHQGTKLARGFMRVSCTLRESLSLAHNTVMWSKLENTDGDFKAVQPDFMICRTSEGPTTLWTYLVSMKYHKPKLWHTVMWHVTLFMEGYSFEWLLIWLSDLCSMSNFYFHIVILRQITLSLPQHQSLLNVCLWF